MQLHHRHYCILIFVCLVELIQAQHSICQAGALDTPLGQFACTNASLSEAICKLSRHCAIPINMVIDGTSEPMVTTAISAGTLREALKSILAGNPQYTVIETNRTILVTGETFRTDFEHPLNQIVDQFDVKYQESPAYSNVVSYTCAFSRPPKALNVAVMSFISFRQPKIRDFPTTRSFRRQKLFDILSQVSEDMNESWCFFQITQPYAKALNRIYQLDRVTPDKWVFNEKSPAFFVTWNGRKVEHDKRFWGFEDEAPNTPEHRNLVEAYWKPRVAVLNPAISTKYLASVRIEAVIAEQYQKDEPILLTLRLKNSSGKQITITNPFLDDPQAAFWAIARADQTPAGYCSHIIVLPKNEAGKEPLEITLDPQQIFERQVDLRGARAVLDPANTDVPPSKRVLLDKIGDLGRYFLTITAYVKTADGVGHALGWETFQFKIVPR